MISWRRDKLPTPVFLGFPGGSDSKESSCNAGDLGSIPGLGRSLGEGNGYPLQYSGLENSMDCISMGLQKVGHDWATFTHSLMCTQVNMLDDHICIYIYLCASENNIYVYIYIHTHTHTYTHINIHVHSPTWQNRGRLVICDNISSKSKLLWLWI